MNTTRLLVLAVLLASVPGVHAAFFPASGTPQSYDFPDGTNAPGDLSTLLATVDGVVSNTFATVQANALKLSTFSPPAGTTATASRLLLPVLDGANVVTSFTVNFDLAFFAATAIPGEIGEGFSLNFGNIPNNTGNGETGFSGMANGLTIGWDTKDNGGGQREVVVYANGTLIGRVEATDLPEAFLIDQTPVFRPVVIRWDAQGLDMTWNGIKVFENLNTPGFGPSVNDRFAFSARTSTANEDVSIDNLLVTTTAQNPLVTDGPVIWEFLARNNDNIEDDEGDRPDWIEIYNGQPAVQSLAGWFLTNDRLNPKQWAFPAVNIIANGFTYVFASGKGRSNAAHAHTNFTLAGEGGWIGLVKPDGTIASQVTYGPQFNDISSGLKSAVDPVAYLSAPSPGKANTVVPNTNIAISKGSDVVTEEPVFANSAGTPLASGFITASQSVTIAPPVTPGAVVRYTTNASNPTEASTLYTAPIPVTNRSLAIRAKVFRTGFIPGPPKTLSLIFRSSDLTNYRNSGKPFESNMPVLMLDSFGVNVDASTDPGGARPYRFTWGMLFDPSQGSTRGKASLSDVPAVASAAGLHVRGQTSSGFPQKPYALEWWKANDTDKDVGLLGMPPDSDWVLYSPYNEETLMRNALVYTTMNQWGGQGAGMRSRFVEVFFNQGADGMSYADYRGVYLLVEKIKQSTSRVDIEKLNEEVTDPTRITGGFVWKKDKPPQVQTISTSSTGPWGGQTFEVIDPNITNAVQKTWLQANVKAFDDALMNNATWQDPVNGYRKYADTASFADNLLWVEAFKQIDGYRLSTHFYKSRSGKIRSLPVWDYNLAAGNANYLGGDHIQGWYHNHLGGGDIPYWPRMRQDPGFVREQWDRFWKARRSVLSGDNINSLINGWSAQIRNEDGRDVLSSSRPVTAPVGGADFDTPASRHFFKNKTLGVYDWPNCNGYNLRLSYQSEVLFLKEWMRQRLEWMEYTSMDGNAGLLKMRAPNFHDRTTGAQTYRARVASGYGLDLIDQDGIAGSTVYYTIDGPDPRTGAGAVDPAAIPLTDASTAVTTFISNAQPWKYSASTTAYPAVQGPEAWNSPAYDDSAWTTGNAPVGYGETGLGTTLTAPALPASGGNQVTCLRKTFSVADPAAIYEFFVELNADDGAVIWINGQEAARCNMPYAPVPITFTSRAIGVLNVIGDSEAENIFVPYRLNPAQLVAGTNTIAVEVHQFQYGVNGNPNASPTNDMRFDLRLKGSIVTRPAAPVLINGNGLHTVRARTKTGNSWSPLSEGEYTVGAEPASSTNLVVSEIMYNPAPPTTAEMNASGASGANNFEYIEVMNMSGNPVDLTGLSIQDAVQMDFSTLPSTSRILAPGARALLVENRTAFLVRYPGREAQILGTWASGNLRNGGELFTLTTNGGATVVRSFLWQAASPWPPLAGADRTAGAPGFSLVLNRPETAPDHTIPSNWRSSGVPGGNPGGSDSVPSPADGSADSDSDGLSDFAEWAFGEDGKPLAATGDYTPQGGVSGTYFFLKVPRNGLADGVTYSAQGSADLENWSSAGFTEIGQEAIGSGEYRVFRSLQPVTGQVRFYMRARAVKQ